MATYTITINERTKSGRSLVGYLRSLGVIDEPDKDTLAAVEEIRNGGRVRCNSFEEYLKAIEWEVNLSSSLRNFRIVMCAFPASFS